MPDPTRPRASLRTAVVWEVLQEALDRRVKATGRDTLDVLDTGGGSGNFAVPLARLGHRVTVVDPSPNALFALERRVAEAGVAERVRGVQGDVLGLFDVVERGGHDVVLCHGVLEHVDDPAEGVRNTVAALRSEGALSLLAAGLGGAVVARALAGHFTEAKQALDDPDGRWGSGDPMPRRFTAEQLTGLGGGPRRGGGAPARRRGVAHPGARRAGGPHPA
ncbi:class I SAM-dependent methyltransferase, partial [Streptomyces sp. NPDC127079]|uniref:class I SAM-dependent methyltransferase n=1 Tax=Streptomyces sp. NPDC127079 TaxID=3347132 RepID=UPI00365F7BCD